MARSRSRSYRPPDVWPGYVDALTTLLLTITFLLTVYVLAQFFLSQTLSGREKVLDRLSQKVVALSEQLAGERKAKRDLAGETAALQAQLQRTTEANAKAGEQVAASARQVDELNARVAELQVQLERLNGALGASDARHHDDQIVISELGERLQAALAEKVAEMARYRSEFFGRMKEVVGERTDVRVVGDRFVFQSEVLFPSGSAELSADGRATLTSFSRSLLQIASEIPAEVSWVLRVDGHTDRVPIASGRFASNWELSTARALSVVKFLIAQHVPPAHLAATGFGEFQPVDTGDDAAARARNRRIEMRLTDR